MLNSYFVEHILLTFLKYVLKFLKFKKINIFLILTITVQIFSLCQQFFSLCQEQNSLCFPCPGKSKDQIPCFPVPWPPCDFLKRNGILGGHSDWSPHTSSHISLVGGEGGVLQQTNSNPNCQDLSKFSFGGGGGESRPIFLKYLSGGTQGIFNQKFWKPSLLLHSRQSLSHYVFGD